MPLEVRAESVRHGTGSWGTSDETRLKFFGCQVRENAYGITSELSAGGKHSRMRIV